MSVSKFMVGGENADEARVLDVLDQSYRAAAFITIGCDEIGLEATPAEAKAVKDTKGNLRVFRVTVEEVQ